MDYIDNLAARPPYWAWSDEYKKYGIKEERAKERYETYTSYGWCVPGHSRLFPITNWQEQVRRDAQNSRPQERVGYTPARQQTPTRPIVATQPTMRADYQEAEREPDYEQKRCEAIARFKGFSHGGWRPENLCFLFGLLSSYRSRPQHVLQVHNVSKPLMKEVNELALLRSKYNIKKEDYL